jgi:hypothetical protein
LNRRLFLLAFLLAVLCAKGQDITVIEYYVDSDPGFGNATSVPFIAAPTITNLTFNIDLDAVTDGFHTLVVRAKDETDNWGIPYSRPFYKLSADVGSPPINVDKIEYYFDTDPGFGAGNDVPVTPGATITNLSFSISLSSTSDGFHTIFVRARDANGNWCATYSRPFYKISASTLAPIANLDKLEYYFDTDPGFGAGIDVSVTPGTAINNLNFGVSLSSTSDGFHTLFVRARDANGLWSATYSRPFYKIGASALASVPNINKIEYYFDTDPGFGAGANVPVTPGTSISGLNFTIPLGAAADGFHTLFVRAKDANDNWSPAYSRPFYKLSTSALAAAPDIDKVEYFFDNDPGFGAGTDVSITPGVAISDHSFTIPMASTSVGFHTLFIRTRDTNGNWSPAYSRPFYKLTATVADPQPEVDKLEYFIDADPGYGSGIDVPVTPGLTLSNIDINIPMNGLPEGGHMLTVRARDTNNHWSIVVIKNFSVCQQPGTTVSVATNITSTSFDISWLESTGSISYQLDVSTDNFQTFVSGYSSKVITAPTLDVSVTGLIQGTNYQYRVRAFASCTSVESNVGMVSTLAAPPSGPPSNLQFTSVTGTSLTAFYTAPSPAPAGYLVVRKVGSSPTFTPVNNTTYSLSQTVGDGQVVYVGTDLLFNQAGLSPDTQYFYDVFAYNISSSFTTYHTTPLEGSVTTIAVQPTAQATNIQFSAVTDVSMTVTFDAATGSPAGYLVLMKPGSAPTSSPADGTVYTTNVGADIVVHNGMANSFSISGLNANTEYHFAIYAYNGSGSSINYFSASPLRGMQLTPITPPATPTNLLFSSITTSTLTLTFSVPSSGASGYLIVRQLGASSSFTPAVNTTYSAGDNVSGSVVVYVGNQTTFDDTSLSASTDYFYDIFAYNSVGPLVGYQPVPLEGHQSTFTSEPTAQPAGLTLTLPTSVSFKVTFAAANPVPAGYLVLRKTSVAPLIPPTDGFAYVMNDIIDGATVAYVGPSTTFDDLALIPGTVYFYVAYSFNGAAGSTNYLTSTSAANSSSSITVPDQPSLGPSTQVGQTSFTINWASVTGATDYRLDLSKDGFVTILTGFDDLVVTGISMALAGLESGTGYAFRVRAANSSGVSASSAGDQFTIPATPALLDASSIGQTTFTANWIQSPGPTQYFIDVSADNFSTFIAGNENKSVGSSLSATISGLTAGSAYQYRVRASNTGGVSPSSSVVEQLLVPATPAGDEASNITAVAFKARWLEAAGADSYRLDVTLEANDFNPSLPNYTDKLVPGDEFEAIVNGLTPSVAYKYRVRAVNNSGTSPSSSPKSVTTKEAGTGVELAIAVTDFTSAFAGPSDITATVAGGTGPYAVTFHHRKITSENYTDIPITNVTGLAYKAAVTADMLDEIGLDFYFTVSDGEGSTAQSVTRYIYRAVSFAGVEIPFQKSGGNPEDWEIFSIPYDLTSPLVGSIFDELGESNKSNWRLIHYKNGNHIEPVTELEPGLGYWFNRKENTKITFAGGTTVTKNQESPFTIILDQGWNQIGNPYLFDIPWADVLAANPALNQVGELHVFNASGYHLNDVSPTLKAWGGGFIINGHNTAVELKIPVTLKGSGRLSNNIAGSELASDEWLVDLSISQGGSLTAAAGIGMHPEASIANDPFDDYVAPRFLNYLEMYTYHDDAFVRKFSADVVPTEGSHTWDFRFDSNSESIATIRWNNTMFGMNEAKLFFFDLTGGLLVDMRHEDHYSFKPKAGHTFRIVFGRDASQLRPELTALGQPYPNPFLTESNIIFVTGKDRSNVSIGIVDMMGKEVAHLGNGSYAQGIHQVEWNGRNGQGDEVAHGVYIVRMMIDGATYSCRIVKR